MLRISVLQESGHTRFKLEGKLAHEWVQEAQVAWTAQASLNGKGEVTVDLFGVSFVDDAGWQLLAQMHRAGAKLVGSGPMTSALIEEIKAARENLNDMVEHAVQLNKSGEEVEQ